MCIRIKCAWGLIGSSFASEGPICAFVYFFVTLFLFLRCQRQKRLFPSFLCLVPDRCHSEIAYVFLALW